MYNENRGMDDFQNILSLYVAEFQILYYNTIVISVYNMYKNLYIIIYYTRPEEKN